MSISIVSAPKQAKASVMAILQTWMSESEAHTEYVRQADMFYNIGRMMVCDKDGVAYSWMTQERFDSLYS